MREGGLDMSEPIKSLINSIVDLIFPPQCLLCGDLDSSGLCRTCRKSFQPLRPPLCSVCSAPVETSEAAPLCARCSDFHPAYDRAWSLFIYDGAIRKAIHDFKYHGVSGLHRVFGELLHERLTVEMAGISIDSVVPVPLHRARELSRGYNQAALLARSLASLLSLPVMESELLRVRHTDFLADLGRRDRFASLEGAFAISEKTRLEGKKILLVDDIMTTGATFHICAGVLREGGASCIYGITLARTVVYDA